MESKFSVGDYVHIPCIAKDGPLNEYVTCIGLGGDSVSGFVQEHFIDIIMKDIHTHCHYGFIEGVVLAVYDDVVNCRVPGEYPTISGMININREYAEKWVVNSDKRIDCPVY